MGPSPAQEHGLITNYFISFWLPQWILLNNSAVKNGPPVTVMARLHHKIDCSGGHGTEIEKNEKAISFMD